MDKYPKIESVYPLPNYHLLIVFRNNVVKVYDCTPLLEEEVFRPLATESLFTQVRAGTGGYGVIWNDELDLSESELWLNGREAKNLPLEALLARQNVS